MLVSSVSHEDGKSYNRCQDGQGRQQPDAWQLQQVGHVLNPVWTGTRPAQLGVDGLQLAADVVESCQILVNAQSLDRGQFQFDPEHAVLLAEWSPFWRW